MPTKLEIDVIGTTLITMVTSWLIFAFIGPRVLRAIFPAYGGLDFNKRILMNETFLSLCHGVVLGPLAFYVFAFDDRVRPDKPTDRLSSTMVHHNCAIFLGYSTADFLLMLRYPSITNPGFLIHHMVSIYTGLTGTVLMEVGWYGNVSMMMELSSPFTNMRVLLDVLGLRKSRAYVINGVVMLVVFFLCRILPVPMYWYHVAQLVSTGQMWDIHPLMIIGFTVGIAAYHFLNIIWFKKMCVGATKILMNLSK